ILQFLAEMYVLRNYALALLFITPLALLMVQLAHPQPVGAMLQARVLETAIGVAVGIGFVIASALFDRRMAARRARLRKQARQRLRERHATPGAPTSERSSSGGQVCQERSAPVRGPLSGPV